MKSTKLTFINSLEPENHRDRTNDTLNQRTVPCTSRFKVTTMNKIINSFDYVFYRLYRFFSSHRFFRGMEQIDSITMIFFILFLPIAALVGCILAHKGIQFEKYSPEYYISMLVGIPLCYGPLMTRYMYNKSISKGKYEVFRDRWGKEDRKQRKRRGWMIALLCINNIIVAPVVIIWLDVAFFCP